MKIFKELWHTQQPVIAASLTLFVVALVIRWLNLTETVSVENVVKVITATAALVGVYVAWSGLSTWKRQLEGNKNHDIAWMCLEKLVVLRNAINKEVRKPFISLEEEEIAKEKLGDTKNHAGVYRLRWDKLQKAREDFNDSLVQAEVWFGDQNFLELCRPLNELIGELYINVKRQTGSFGIKGFPEHDVLYHVPLEPNNPFDLKIKAATQSIDSYFRSYLKQ